MIFHHYVQIIIAHFFTNYKYNLYFQMIQIKKTVNYVAVNLQYPPPIKLHRSRHFAIFYRRK